MKLLEGLGIVYSSHIFSQCKTQFFHSDSIFNHAGFVVNLGKSKILDCAALCEQMFREPDKPSECSEHSKHHQDTQSVKFAKSAKHTGGAQHIEVKKRI